jgi:hypothetical protein
MERELAEALDTIEHLRMEDGLMKFYQSQNRIKELERELAESHEMIIKMETGARETGLELFLMQDKCDNRTNAWNAALDECERLRRESLEYREQRDQLAAAIRRHRDAMQDTNETSADDHILWNSLTPAKP